MTVQVSGTEAVGTRGETVGKGRGAMDGAPGRPRGGEWNSWGFVLKTDAVRLW